MERVRVDLGEKSYDIYIGDGILNQLDQLIGPSEEQGFIISDRNVYRLHGHRLDSLQGYEWIIIEPGEESKSLVRASHVLEQMLNLGGSRKSKLIAFGGGVVGDLGGFCSSVYMRGIDYIQIPTSLLAQVDSSVGGKTAINFLGHKNIIGSFHQPSRVIVDTSLLTSLAEREILNGLGEIVKYGIIYDYELFKYIGKNIGKIKNLDREIMPYLIGRCCQIKGEIVARDEKEEGLRKILNFGHTLAHGLESITNFSKYSHGQAVIIGMYQETLLAKRLGIVDSHYSDQLLEFLTSLGVDLSIGDYPSSQLVDFMLKDKKNRAGKISFILPIEKGRVKEYLLDKNQIGW